MLKYILHENPNKKPHVKYHDTHASRIRSFKTNTNGAKKERAYMIYFFLFSLLFASSSSSSSSSSSMTTHEGKEGGIFVPMPPPIPEDFDGDVYVHTEKYEYTHHFDDENDDISIKSASGNGGRRRRVETEEEEEEDDDEQRSKIPLLNSAFYSKQQKRKREEKEKMTFKALKNAREALERAKNGKTSELERNLETLGRYLEDMESVLSGKGDDDGSIVVADLTKKKEDYIDVKNNGGGGRHSSHLSRKSYSTDDNKYQRRNDDENGKRLLRLASVQKFPHPITSVRFTRHRERDLRMEIYDTKGDRDDETVQTGIKTTMKVMPGVDDVVPKIVLVADEKGTLFALDVKSGEILCKHDVEKSGRNAITTIESYAVAQNDSNGGSSSSSSNSAGSSKGKSSEKAVDTRIVVGRADGSVTFFTMSLDGGDESNDGSPASLRHCGTFTPTTTMATMETGSSRSKKQSFTSEALSQRHEEEKQGRDVAVVASYVAMLHNGERRVIVANGKGMITILKEDKDTSAINNNAKVILSEESTFTSEQTNIRGRIVSFQSVMPSKAKRKRLRQQKQHREKTDIMAITSRGEILILSLSLSSDLSSFEVVPCTAPGGHVRTAFDAVSDGDFEPTSLKNSAHVVLDASQLAYLKVTGRENLDKEEEDRTTPHYSCLLSSARPLKFGLSLLSSSSSSSPEDKEAENLTTIKVISLRDGVTVLSTSPSSFSPSSPSSSTLFNGIRAYETNTDFKTRGGDEATYFAKDGVKFSWRDVLYDITKGEEDGEQLDNIENANANAAIIAATGDGRRTIALALPSHPSVLIFYRWQGGMSELERNRALMRQQHHKNAYSASDTVFNAFTRVLESKITPAVLVGLVSYYTFFVKNKDAAVRINERARIDYAKLMHTARQQQLQNGDPPQFKRDSRKLYREFDPKKFRREVLVPIEKMKMTSKSKTTVVKDEAPAGA